MRDTIIFDLGGVIEKINPNAVIFEFRKIGMLEPNKFFSLYRQSEICSLFESGKIERSEFIEHLRSLCEGNASDAILEAAWCSNQLGVPQATVDILSELKKMGVNLFILSNTNCIHAEYVEKTFSEKYRTKFNRFFRGVYYSYRIKERKPNERSYKYLLKNASLSPGQCIYIDDIEKNLRVPYVLGMCCLLHTTNTNLNMIDLTKMLTK